MSVPSADLDRRRPVWDALSELFLDTELREPDIRRIAKVAADSGYSHDELEGILYDELFPILIWNLRSPAGEWVGFDPAWLEQRILARERRRFRCPRWLLVGRSMIRDEWARIVSLTEAYRLEVKAS